MRTLWRTTVCLFWQHPILWVPVLLADATAFSLRWLEGWVRKAITDSLIAGHSVLTDRTEPLRTLPVAWAPVFAASKLLVEFLNLCFYTAAMIAISLLIPALIAKTKVQWRKLLPRANPLRVDVLLFSLKLFGTILLAVFLYFALITCLARFNWMFATIGSSYDQHFATFGFIFASIAWLLAPGAVAILQPRESPPVDAASLRNARNFAALHVLASTAIYRLAGVARPSFAPLLTTVFLMRLYWMVASAASAFPYVALFIALSLIANPEAPLAIPPSADPEPDNLLA